MILTSFIEILSIGSVVPFLSALTAPDTVFESPIIQPLIYLFKINTANGLLIPMAVFFCSTAILSASVRLMLLWRTANLSFSVGAELSAEIYRKSLYQPYHIHISRNSSEIINGISNKANTVIYSTVLPILNFISGAVLLTTILVVLIYLNPLITFIAFLGFGFSYVIVVRLIKNRLYVNSKIIAYESNNVIQSIQEGLGGIRDVLIDGSQEIFCKKYEAADSAVRGAQGSNHFLSISPKYIMEGIGLVLIAILALIILGFQDSAIGIIPMLGALALGSQRLLPLLQQLYSSWASLQGGLDSLGDVVALLNQSMPKSSSKPLTPISFTHEIRLSNISFGYEPSQPLVLRQINLIILKGEKVGVIGKSGCGKSTFLDVLMGLLQPSEGKLKVDGEEIRQLNARNWQENIAHVPQSIYLSDASIMENIAFGVPIEEIDIADVIKAAKGAKIDGWISRLPNQYLSGVGERGLRLSGGQRQRIGLARALYKKSSLIILDEATSSLDTATEESIMETVHCLDSNITIIMVAHRLSTLKDCTKIIKIENGKIKSEGSYSELINIEPIKNKF
ncbi:ABC transporter ATP-binding protein [Polynucleobacter tropicus]|uniref:Cyclolysin secretion/processing ATP-binding protein CyaB n=2 Tax=Polynucleobacter tropicus TaxID=1743174 RepID=A0A6M9PT61_9BURK|nr:ABC transporter ATP-binding protein [Polynucleobacter tropicus]